MGKDYKQLWEGVSSAPNKAEAIRDLVEIVTDSDGRAFALRLGPKDAVLCIETLDYGIAGYNLETAERSAFSLMLRRLAERHGILPDRMMVGGKVQVSDKIAASGIFGSVRIGTYMERRIAVKVAKLSMGVNLKKIKKQFYKEVLLWDMLSHPNVLKLVGVWVDMEKGEFATVSEWMEHGNIMEFIAHNHTNRLELLHGAAQGLQYLHDVGVTHGDLRGANILMSNDSPPRPCLADFSFTAMALAPDQQISCSAQLEGGTTMFMSPELLMPQHFGKKYAVPTQEADIYAFGFVIFQVLTGELPFRHIQTVALALYAVEGRRPEKPEDASEIGFSDLLWNFTQRCWDGKIASRPKVGEVVTNLGEAMEKWDGLMPPHIRTESAASDPEEEWSDSMEYSGIFQSSSAVWGGPTESQPPPEPFSHPSTSSTECTESPQEGPSTVVSTPPRGLTPKLRELLRSKR